MCLPLWGQHNIIQLNIVILLCSGNIVILFCSINVVILLCSGNTFVSMSPSFTNFKVLDPVNDWVRVLTWYVTHRLRRQTLANRLVRNICKKQVQFDFKCFLGNGNGHSESDADTAMYICTCQYRSCQYRTWQYRSGQYRTCQYKRGNIGVYCTRSYSNTIVQTIVNMGPNYRHRQAKKSGDLFLPVFFTLLVVTILWHLTSNRSPCSWH